jgi:glycosyltransferase involved in cell wall biosynthesis
MDPTAELPRIAREPISVALPVRNQAAALDAGVTAWVNYLNGLGRPYELLVVDDGSRDDSAARLDALAARFPRVRVLRHFDPAGVGAALLSALRVAQYPLFAYTTLDYPYTPADLKKLLDRIDEAHVATGYRADAPPPALARRLGRAYRLALRVLLGLTPRQPLGWRGLRGSAYALLCRALFGLRVQDIDSGLKLFRRSLFARIPLQSHGPFVHAEILAKANFLGALMDEVPVAQRPGPFAAVPMSPIPNARGRAAELSRVFSHPDFGPPDAPTPPTPAPQTASQPG